MKFDEGLILRLVISAREYYEHYKHYGAEIENALDMAIFDLYPNDDDPEGLYDLVLDILKS